MRSLVLFRFRALKGANSRAFAFVGYFPDFGRVVRFWACFGACLRCYASACVAVCVLTRFFALLQRFFRCGRVFVRPCGFRRFLGRFWALSVAVCFVPSSGSFGSGVRRRRRSSVFALVPFGVWAGRRACFFPPPRNAPFPRLSYAHHASVIRASRIRATRTHHAGSRTRPRARYARAIYRRAPTGNM